MALRTLLLDPPHKLFGGLRMWMPSPGLLALAAYLEHEDLHADLIDATTLERPWSDLTERLRAGAYDLVGVTCSAATFHRDALAAVRLVRKVLPLTFVVAGGSHVTLNAARFMEEAPELDCVVLGEGEKPFASLIRTLEAGGSPDMVEGTCTRRGDRLRSTPPAPPVADLDALPFPAYHRVDLNHPTYALHGMGRRAVGISTSRGCGDACTYCSEAAFWQSRWRGRSGALVVQEMRRLQRDFGKSLFVFNENSFNQNRLRNEAFLENLGRSGMRCDFWFQSRVKDILRDRDLLDDFKRLGCYEVMLGVESIQPETLHNYRKNQTLEQVREASELLRSRGMMVMTNVMFGDEPDTEETLRAVYEFACEIGDFLVLTLTTPLPGTRYYDRALAEGRIEETDMARYDFMHPIMPNRRHTREEIKTLQDKYLRKYYTRPKVFGKMLFSPNRFIRMSYRLIMRHAWYEARGREWVQPNYEPIPQDLMSGGGRSPREEPP